MSQQIGVPAPGSVETTPPAQQPQFTTSSSSSEASHPSMPPGEQISETANIDSSVKPTSNSRSSSSTISGKVEIPKLSAATTELLARVTGNIQKGGAKRDGHEERVASWSPSSFDTSLTDNNNNWNTQGVGKMRASAYMELPPTTFAPPDIAPSSTGSSVPVQGNYTQSSAGLINLAPKPAGPAPGTVAGAIPVKRRTATNGTKRTTKRRRRGDDDDEEGIIRAGDSSSDESANTPVATQTKSGRQVHRPSLYVPPPAPSPVVSNRNSATASSDNLTAPATSSAAGKRKRSIRKGKEVNISCIHCQRSHSPLTNTIVFCDWCNRAWHQLCHDPCIDDEVVQVKEKEWLCKVCKPVPLSDTQPTVLRSNPSIIPSQLVRIPLESPPLEVGGAGFSDDERRGYLSSLPHATLVELLATLSDRNPNLPMFPGNLKALPSSKLSFESSISAAAPGPSASSTNATTVATSTQEITSNSNFTTEAPPVATSSSTTKQKHRHESSDDDDESEYEVFEEHRLYPRAGNGFRFSLNPDDLDILREDPACPTFSYSLHGPAKDRAEANDAAPIWATA